MSDLPAPKNDERDGWRFVDGQMAFGDICFGWTPAAWAAELRRKADRCDAYRPDFANYYRRWAADIERRLPGSRSRVSPSDGSV